MKGSVRFGSCMDNDPINFLLVAGITFVNYIIFAINCVLFIVYFRTMNKVYLWFGFGCCFITLFSMILTCRLYYVLTRKQPQIDIYVDEEV